MSESQYIKGKTCLITGATNGIGRVTAVELARMGAELFLIYRDKVRADETVAKIRNSTGNENVHLLHADLGSQRQIRDTAAEFLNTGRPLHLLVNNAGLGNTKRMMTEDGIEMVFAVNHLAYFLLTMLLLDRIKQSAPARIVNRIMDDIVWDILKQAARAAEMAELSLRTAEARVAAGRVAREWRMSKALKADNLVTQLEVVSS
jgi:hypothetical protein